MVSLRVLALLPLVTAMHGCTSLDTGSGVNMRPGSTKSTSDTRPSSIRLAKPPQGFVDFCERSPHQCTVAPSSPRSLLLDAQAWETLETVNRITNLAISPKDDSVHYGMEEYWTIPTDGYGDCDDYVLAKRSALIEEGIPRSALSIAIVVTPRLVRHTVLIVATNKGTYVLDNLRDEIVTWDKTDYGWIKRQDSSSQSGWAYF